MHSSTKQKMPEKHVYEYAVIRIVPRVERGEFLNAGVILFCKRQKFLAMRYVVDETRLNAFSPGLDLEEVRAYLQAWDIICQGKREGGDIALKEASERFRWLTAAKSTILQCSKVHPGISDDPDRVLDDLYQRYVL